MAYPYFISVKEEIPSVPIPYRLRLSDANKNVTINNRDRDDQINKMVPAPQNSENLEDRWDRFLNEFLVVHDDEFVNFCSQCKKEGIHSLNTSDKAKQKVWIPVLKMYLSSAKATVFEKYWKKLLLGERTFSRKAAEARKNMKALQDRYKEQQAREISEAAKRLEELKRNIRENADKARKEERERLEKIKQMSKHRIDLIINEKTKNNGPLQRKPSGKSYSPWHQKQGTMRGSVRSPRLPKIIRNMTSSSPRRKKSHNLFLVEDIPEIDSSISDFEEFNEAHIDTGLRKIEDMEKSNEESRESSPELMPVEMPDWVKDFLERKRKAKEELEAAKSAPQNKMPIPVMIGDNTEVIEHNNIDLAEAEIDYSSNMVARQLDFTANIMAKKAPYPFGMSSREIPDSCITASSQQDPFHRPSQARLNNEHNGKNAGAWCPKKHNNNQWLQIDIGRIRKIQQIAIQGMPMTSVKRPKDRRWVESFALSYSDSGDGWKYYEDENNNPKVFIGNTDLINTAKCSLVNGLMTRFIRIHPVSWNNGIALRVEIYGERETEDDNTEGNHLIPADATALQRYASRPDSEPIDFDSTEDDCNDDDGDYDNDDDDSASEYIFKDDEDELYEATEGQEINRYSVASEVAPVIQEEFKVSETDTENVAQEMAGNAEETSVDSNAAEHDEEIETSEEQERKAKQKEEELLREAEERKRLLKEEAGRKFVEELRRQERADKRKLRFQNAVQKLTRRGSKGTGIVLDQDDEDTKEDFLTMYCVLKESQKILFDRVFKQFDKDEEGFIDQADVISALRALNLNVLKESEMMYIRKIISVFEPPNDRGIDKKTFNVIAAFSDRLKNVDVITRGFIRKTNFEALYMNAHKTRDLFERLLEGNERTISLELFLIELEAGGVRDENRKIVAMNMKDRKFLDFLDFVLYYPLILYTHDNIMTAPL